MMRQDYILRLIAELRQFVGAMIGSGDPGQAGEALHAVLHAQEQLFHRPPTGFVGLALEEQVELLGRGESAGHATEKVATYAATLEQAARVYETTNRDPLALNSRQLGLGVLLVAAQRWPEQRASLAAEISTFRAQLPDYALNPLVRKLWDDWDANSD